MLITDKRQSLNDSVPIGEYHDNDIDTAMLLLFDIMDTSFACSENCRETVINGEHKNISSLYWDCRRLFEEAGSNPERTGFLLMSIIEQKWMQVKPLLLFSLESLQDGKVMDEIRRLENLLDDNPYRKAWKERSYEYRFILDSAGFHTGDTMFENLTDIMEPLLDALTFYKDARVYRVRSSPRSECKNPMISDSIYMFRSEKEVVDSAMSGKDDACIFFAAVEKTNRQTKDWFFEWFHGYADERQRNIMKNENLTKEQYLDAPCDMSRKIMLCIRSGGTVWLVHIPWNGDYYSRIGEKYHYGRRTSYAPYQIFCESGGSPGDKNTSMPSIKRNVIPLPELLDGESMAWLPAFLDETIKYFFNDTEPASEDLILMEETVADIPKRNPLPEVPNAVVPVISGMPDICSYRYIIKHPEELFNEPWMVSLIRHFGIVPTDIKNIPILPNHNGSRDAFDRETDKRLRLSYIRIMAEKIADLMQEQWGVRTWCIEKIAQNCDEIIKNAGNGYMHGCMRIIIEGAPVLDKNGNPVMKQRDRKPWDEVAETVRINPEDAMERRNLNENFCHSVLWAGVPTAGKPPVVWKLHPTDAEDYATIFSMDEKELPEILRMSGPISKFYDTYKAELPMNITNAHLHLAKGYGSQTQKSCFIPCFAPINICMSKKTYRNFPCSGMQTPQIPARSVDKTIP